jgi:hypothetical protein
MSLASSPRVTNVEGSAIQVEVASGGGQKRTPVLQLGLRLTERRCSAHPAARPTTIAKTVVCGHDTRLRIGHALKPCEARR